MNSFVDAHLGTRYRRQSPLPNLTATQANVRDQLLSDDRRDDWEQFECLCGSTGGQVLTEVDRYGLPYRKVLCTDCGLLRVTPRWTAARYARFYQDHYRDLYSPLASNDGAETLRRLAAGAGATLVSQFVEQAWNSLGSTAVPNPVIIEIGAGGGWNLARLSQRWTRIGYDADERFLELGRSTFGIDMRNGFVAEALLQLQEADVILLSHVLEHVPDPVATLRALSAAARPDALILIEVPGIFRLHKTSLDPMQYWQNAHTFTFCAKTVVDTCRRAGLEPLQVDEWIRLALRPSSVARSQVTPDPALGPSIQRYLHYCELSYRLAQCCGKLPLLGRSASLAARRSADALMRVAGSMGLVHGMRSSATMIKHDHTRM
jgi:2-polyprenyl-3-methyl-5-hydroxy-6-metoxy-1,4-benzoquinol methylase